MRRGKVTGFSIETFVVPCFSSETFVVPCFSLFVSRWRLNFSNC
jgi:hypothetical protein